MYFQKNTDLSKILNFVKKTLFFPIKKEEFVNEYLEICKDYDRQRDSNPYLCAN